MADLMAGLTVELKVMSSVEMLELEKVGWLVALTVEAMAVTTVAKTAVLTDDLLVEMSDSAMG